MWCGMEAAGGEEPVDPVEQEIFHMITSHQLTSNHNMCDVQKRHNIVVLLLFDDKIVKRGREGIYFAQFAILIREVCPALM